MTTSFDLSVPPLRLRWISASPAYCDVIKVGIIGTMSGPYALFGQNSNTASIPGLQNMARRSGDHEIQFIYRDEESPNPAKSKALRAGADRQGQGSVHRGLYFTPDAMAVAPLLQEAKVPMIVMNAATSAIVEKSPYIVRTSFTMWQNAVPAAKVAKEKGAKKVAIASQRLRPWHRRRNRVQEDLRGRRRRCG